MRNHKLKPELKRIHTSESWPGRGSVSLGMTIAFTSTEVTAFAEATGDLIGLEHTLIQGIFQERISTEISRKLPSKNIAQPFEKN